MKKYRSIILALLVFVGGLFLFGVLSEEKIEPSEETAEEELTPVSIERLEFSNKPFLVHGTGRVKTQNSLSLRSEVSGKILPSRKVFRPGISYNKGEVIFKIDDSDLQYEIQILKSSIISRLSSLLPDLAVDFKEEYNLWNNYFAKLSLGNKFPNHPQVKNTKLSNFLATRGFFADYFQMRKLETVQKKYIISAPFDCTVSEGQIEPGTLVTPGQPLGVIINPFSYEMSLFFKSEIASKISIGTPVKAFGEIHGYRGRVVRKGSIIDPQSQQQQVFVAFENENLLDGAYLNAEVEIKTKNPISEIDKSLINSEGELWAVDRQSKIHKEKLEVLYEHQNRIIISKKDTSTIFIPTKIQSYFEEGKQITHTLKK